MIKYISWNFNFKVACIHDLFSLWERCWEFCWRAPHEEIIDGAVAKSQCKTAPGAWLICMWLDIALSLLQDYPSLAQLHEKLRDSNILPIFAVTELVSDLYQVAILLFILFSFIFYLYFQNLLCCVMFIMFRMFCFWLFTVWNFNYIATERNINKQVIYCYSKNMFF